MPDYRRLFRPGGTYFFTVVTYRRAPFLCDDLARPLLRAAINQCQENYPFTTDALVLLPDHLHAIWTLPQGDSDFSGRWGRIKKSFTQAWMASGGWEGAISDSRISNRRRGVWQRRFWEHMIRDQRDYERHLDYIHYNPVKHSYARCAHGWDWSTFHKLIRQKVYEPSWCCSCNGQALKVPDFGDMEVENMEDTFGE
jgi:putative transposase